MWNSVIGQRRAKENLQRAIVSDRVAHAYCFWGPEGVGKEALAIEFARCMNCMQPVQNSDTIESCGQCQSCRQMEHLQHQNLKLIFALPTGKSGTGDDDNPASRLSEDQLGLVQEQIQLKAENPYHNFALPQASQIRIASIREIKKSIQLSQAQSGRRVVVICEADQMTTEAANAFLKTLEEPQENITMILCTSRKDQLPQTILSRCQQLQMESLSDEDIIEALEQRSSLDHQSAVLCASLAQGSFSQALSLQDDDAQQLRNDVVDLLRASLRGGPYRLDLMSKIDELTSSADRPDIEKMLVLLLVWMRDAMLLHTTDSDHSLINQDQQSTIRKFVQAYGERDYSVAIERVEECIRAIRGNGQVHLNLVTLLLSLRRLFLN